MQRVLSLRGGDVARNSDSAKVPTRNRNSELQVTSHQTVRVFEACVSEMRARGQDPPSATGGRCSVSSTAKACLAPNASPFWQPLRRHLPGHRHFGSHFGDISPAIAILAATSETSPRPSPFWQPLPRHLPGHRRFGSRFRDISASVAKKRGLGEVNYRYSPKIGWFSVFSHK